MKTLIVIPARLGSTRLARKMLLRETGKTLIEHTYLAAKNCRLADRVIIATDDQEIYQAARGFNAEVEMTSADHLSGTDRVAEVASRHHDMELIVNLQGDEPEMASSAVDLAIEQMQHHDVPVSTVACPIHDRSLLDDASCVKVVLSHSGRALYFSRSAIPHPRNWDDRWLAVGEPPRFLQHLGIYVYRRDFLLAFSQLPESPAEKTESLEQLRVLQAGHAIQVAISAHSSKGIDTPEDYQAFVKRIQMC